MMYLKAFALALTLATPALAQDLPAPLGDTVSDFADALDPAAEGRITQALQTVRSETGVQMVVVTVPGIAAEGGTGQTIEAYGKALFNAWGIGGADRDDGILLLLDTQSREARIALGSGYDPVYDGRAARVLSTAVLPELRTGNIAAGVEAGIVSARDRLITPFLAGTPVSVTDGFVDLPDPSNLNTGLLGFGAVAGIAGFAIWRNARKRKTCPSCGSLTLQRTREVIEKPSRRDTGVGMQHLTCPTCGFNDHKTYPVRWNSREAARDRTFATGQGGSSGESRSGFGGGRSSGGGASGKW